MLNIPILVVYTLIFLMSSHFALQFTLCFYACNINSSIVGMAMHINQIIVVYTTLLISDHYSHFLDKIMVNT